MALCPVCSSPLAGSERRCPACGSRVSSDDASNQAAPPPPAAVEVAPAPPVDAAPPYGASVAEPSGGISRNALIAGGAIGAVAVAALAFVLFTGGGDDVESQQSGAPTTSSAPTTVVTTTLPPETTIDDGYIDAVDEEDIDDVPDTSVTTPETVPELPAVTPSPVIWAATASSVRLPSSDACGNPTFYDEFQIFDGRPDTAWMAPGNAIGERVILDLLEPARVRQVGLIPGYDKIDPCASDSDRFFDLRRITSVTWTFDDGYVLEQRPDPNNRNLQTIDVPVDIVTRQVRLTITGTLPPGLERLDHTVISEVVIR